MTMVVATMTLTEEGMFKHGILHMNPYTHVCVYISVCLYVVCTNHDSTLSAVVLPPT